MKTRLAAFLSASALLILGTAPLLAADSAEAPPPPTITLPTGTLTANQVRTLFADKTVTSETAVKKRQSQSYYAPTGEVKQLSDGVKRTGRWRVTDSGRMCLQMENLPEKCRIIVNDHGTYKKYIVKKNGRHEHSITYKDFRKGNALGL